MHSPVAAAADPLFPTGLVEHARGGRRRHDEDVDPRPGLRTCAAPGASDGPSDGRASLEGAPQSGTGPVRTPTRATRTTGCAAFAADARDLHAAALHASAATPLHRHVHACPSPVA